jgi:hypothetical protein
MISIAHQERNLQKTLVIRRVLVSFPYAGKMEQTVTNRRSSRAKDKTIGARIRTCLPTHVLRDCTQDICGRVFSNDDVACSALAEQASPTHHLCATIRRRLEYPRPAHWHHPAADWPELTRRPRLNTLPAR